MFVMTTVVAVIAALAAMDGAAASEPGRASAQELDEVTVYGSQDHISNLRQAMVDAEDRFYARYNELNAVDEFDVSCRDEARTGTKLRRRSCRGLYEDRARHEEGVEAFKIRQFIHDSGGKLYMPASPPVPAEVAIEARRPEFQRNMRDLVSRNEELVQLLAERTIAIDRFEAAKRASSEPEGPGERSSESIPPGVNP